MGVHHGHLAKNTNAHRGEARLRPILSPVNFSSTPQQKATRRILAVNGGLLKTKFPCHHKKGPVTRYKFFGIQIGCESGTLPKLEGLQK
jgi:hypothetical protein